jgi:8-oxo-dGTP diphosphatase
MTKENFQTKILGPGLAVDTVVMTIKDDRLHVLLIQIGSGPYKDRWALPGGLVNLGEIPEQAAIRALSNKTNIKVGHLEQLFTFGELDRDVRAQIVSVAYMLLIPDPSALDVRPQDFYTAIKWVPITELPKMAFDHKKIAELAYRRLQDKVNYSTIASSLLSEEFTLTQLQKVYEIILGMDIDKRNFRKKMLALGIIQSTEKIQRSAFRPAELYSFNKKAVTYF